jgi:hypothetical protein
MHPSVAMALEGLLVTFDPKMDMREETQTDDKRNNKSKRKKQEI